MSDLISREKLLNEINLLKKDPWYNKDFAAVKLVRKDAVAIVEMYIKEAPSVTGWIKCSDRLPEPLTDVLVYQQTPHGDCAIGISWRKENGEWMYKDICETLYWMPLPELPKE